MLARPAPTSTCVDSLLASASALMLLSAGLYRPVRPLSRSPHPYPYLPPSCEEHTTPRGFAISNTHGL